MFQQQKLLLCILILQSLSHLIICKSHPILCSNPEQAPLECEMETKSFIKENIEEIPQKLQIVEYNIDRNGRGGDGPNEGGLKPLIAALKSLGDIDILLLSEVSRDCTEWEEQKNGAEEIAKEFNMEYYYVVEFIEIDQSDLKKGRQCTIGNAILSKYKMSNIQQKRFNSQCCMFDGRYGGRIGLTAMIEQLKIQVITSHLESATGVRDLIQGMFTRNQQSKELVQLQDKNSDYLVVIGGDFNTPLRQFYIPYYFQDFTDPLSHYQWPFRNTCVNDPLDYFGLGAFDYLYFKNHDQYKLRGIICKKKACKGFSDHFPIQVKLERKE